MSLTVVDAELFFESQNTLGEGMLVPQSTFPQDVAIIWKLLSKEESLTLD